MGLGTGAHTAHDKEDSLIGRMDRWVCRPGPVELS